MSLHKNFLSNCSVLLKLESDIFSRLGGEKCILMLIVYGGVLENGCRSDSDIDLLMVTRDNCDVDEGAVNEIVERYRREGVVLSLNIITLSDLLKAINYGDTLALKATITGFPIIGHDIFHSIRKFASNLHHSLQLNDNLLREKVITLINEAEALLSLAHRDLYSACGRVKTALGYILAIKTGSYDPDSASKIIANEDVSKAYMSISNLCKSILNGSIPLRNIIQHIKDVISIIENELKT